MSGKWNGRRCSNCGLGTLHDGLREKRTDYRGHMFVAQYPGAYCDRCDDGIAYDDPTVDADWESFRRRIDEAERLELAAIRSRLGLTQEQASRISGGGHNAFSRYERGEAQPVLAVITLFRLLDRHPALLRECDADPKYYSSVSVSDGAAEGSGRIATVQSGSDFNVIPISWEHEAANEWGDWKSVIPASAEAA